jgi:phosphonate transport system substrate-binding protein
MMRIVLSIVMVFLFSGLSWAAELKIGLIPEQNVFRQFERYEHLGKYIESKTGMSITFTVLPRYGNIIQRFIEDKMDGAFLGSFTGALAITRLELDPIARPVNLDGTSTYCGYIFVRKDSGIKNMSDMKGKRLAFVDRATTAGYIFPMAWFKANKLNNIDAYFSEYYFAGSHDAAIYAVLNQEADVGCAKHSMFNRVARRDKRARKDLIILVKSPMVPSNGLIVKKNLSDEVKKRLHDTLVDMENDRGGKATLKKFEALRFLSTTKDHYKPVFDIARNAGIDIKKYEYFNE